MKKIHFIIAFCAIASIAAGQTPKNLQVKNADNIINKGIEAYDNEKFDDANALYGSVLFGDSLYYWAQYELALTKYAQKQYQEAAEILEKIPEWANAVQYYHTLNLLGNAYDELGQQQKALECYQRCEQIVPYNYMPKLNKAVVFLKQKEFSQMETALKQAIFHNPSHSRQHFLLGQAFLQQKQIIPAILALNYSVVLYPNSNWAVEALSLLNDIYLQNDYETMADGSISDETKDRNKRFKTLETLIKSNYVTSGKLKAKTNINHIITLQNQLVFENLEAKAKSKDIVDLLYIPVFKALVADKKTYNDFCYMILQRTNIDNNKVNTKAQKMQKKFNNLISQIIIPNLNSALAQGLEQNTKNITYNYDNNFVLEDFGKYNSSNKKEGVWTVIEEQSVIEVTYKNGVEDGRAKIYKKGKLAYEYDLKGDNIVGEVIVYYPQEKDKPLKIKQIYSLNKNGEKTGTKKFYNYAGFLTENSNWENGFYNGKVETFYNQGSKKFDGFYKNGNVAGNTTEYFENGKIKFQYVQNPDKTFAFTSYYTSGKPKMEGVYADSVLVGNYTKYYSTGEKQETGFYNEKGDLQGKVIDYYKNGQLQSEAVYADGKSVSLVNYCQSGNKFVATNFKDGKVQEVIVFNADGTEKERVKQKNGVFVYDLYFYDENNIAFKFRTVSIDENGNLHGLNYEYSPQGTIIEKANYANGKADGETFNYYPSGQISKYAQFKDGNYNGFSLEYYQNGKMQSEALCKENYLSGVQYKYNSDEQLNEKMVFDDDFNIVNATFFYNDKVDYENFYQEGMLQKSNLYDENGVLLRTNTFDNGTGKYNAYYLNGNISFARNLVAGEADGIFTEYDINGKVFNSYEYKAGKIDGLQKVFDRITRKLYYQGNYNAGELNEKVVFYEDGIKTSERNFAENQDNGKAIFYFDNGKISSEREYENGVRDGLSIYFAPDGKTVRYKILFFRNIPYAISVMNADGKLSDYQQITKQKQTFTSYYSNGVVSSEITFENGLWQDDYKIFYPSGKLCSNSKFDKDVNIADMDYYENGNLYSERYFKNGELHGEQKFYHQNGNLKRVENYKLGNLDGEVKIYDVQGKLIETQTWFNDTRKK